MGIRRDMRLRDTIRAVSRVNTDYRLPPPPPSQPTMPTVTVPPPPTTPTNRPDRSILIDDRVGSKDLYIPLSSLGLPVKLCRMESADIRFTGLGECGATVTVGVERKRIKDALNSMRTGRFMGHQAVELSKCADAVLLIEGAYRCGEDGQLETYQPVSGSAVKWRQVQIGPSTFSYQEFDNWLNSVAILTPIRVVRSNSASESCRIIADLWRWWSKPLDSHKSANVFHRTTPDKLEMVKPSLVRSIAKELPGLGWEKSRHVETRFRSVIEMILATEDEWQELPGVGEKLAKKIVEAIHETL